MSKNAVIYARVSTDDQAEHGYSLPSQIESCEKFASQKSFDIAAVFQDDVSGAKPVASRPEGKLLQRAIDSGQVKVVIVFQIDRLSRDIVDLLTTVRDWLQAGIEIYSLDVGQITSELDIVLVIKGWQGSDERQKIRERTTRGKNAKAKAGKVVGVGSSPYGYNYSGGELVIDEAQAQIVSMIFDWYVRGDDYSHMMSLYTIAERLTKMGIPTPSNVKGLIRNGVKTIGWSSGVIRQLIVSETYSGVWRYGKYIGEGGRGGRRPVEEQIAVNVPAIISREMWELAQERRAYNSKIARRRMKRQYLLRGLVYCGCGHAMVGGGGRGEHLYYYYCTRRYGSGLAIGSGVCTEPLVKGGLIEFVTWDYILNLIKDPQQFETKLRQAQAKEAATIQPKEKELDHVIALLEDTEKEAEEIACASRKAKGLIAAKLERQGDEVNKRYEALTQRKSELQEALAIELTDDMISDLLRFREVVALGLENPTFEDRRRWLEILQTKVTVTNCKAVVACRLGGTPFQYDLIALQTSVSGI